jgi:myo-inositol-1(or 4)-monophosphatase
VIDSYPAADDAAVATAAAGAGAEVVRSMHGRQLSRIDEGAGDFATAADVISIEVHLVTVNFRRNRPLRGTHRGDHWM